MAVEEEVDVDAVGGRFLWCDSCRDFWLALSFSRLIRSISSLSRFGLLLMTLLGASLPWVLSKQTDAHSLVALVLPSAIDWMSSAPNVENLRSSECRGGMESLASSLIRE